MRVSVPYTGPTSFSDALLRHLSASRDGSGALYRPWDALPQMRRGSAGHNRDVQGAVAPRCLVRLKSGEFIRDSESSGTARTVVTTINPHMGHSPRIPLGWYTGGATIAVRT
jgi:hypothetical protein